MPAAKLRAITIGEADCIENGESIVNSTPTNELQEGFAPGCIIAADEFDRLWQIVSDYEDCCTQRAFALLVLCVYETDEVAALKIVRDWLGPLPVVTLHAHAGIRCGLLTIKTPVWIIGVCDGTWNFQEFALQALSFVAGPTDFSFLSTAPLWWSTSTYINNLLNADGQTADMRLMMVGHSYGGAVALTSCARYRAWAATREIVYLTFGCPKIGDRRFVNLLKLCDGLNIAAEDDIVPVLPPDKLMLAPILGAFPGIPLLLYTEWLRPDPQVLLRDNGSMAYQSYTFLDTTTVLKIITRAVLHQQFDTIDLHRIPRYITRLQTRCDSLDAVCTDPLDFVITYPSQAIAFNTPLRPRGAIVFNHPSIPDTRGTTCQTAILVALGETVTLINPTDKRWYKIAIADGQTLHIEASCVGGFLGRCSLGPDCDHLVFQSNIGGVNVDTCNDFTSVTDEFLWVRWTNISSAGPVIFTPDVGACP